MGVHHLWKIVDRLSKTTTPDAWSGKNVAVDASVWMIQFRSTAGGGRMMGDGGGFDTNGDVSNRLLEGFTRRILKLLFYDITPIFVFDGPASGLKAKERERRHAQRLMLQKRAIWRHARRAVLAHVQSGLLPPEALDRIKTQHAPRMAMPPMSPSSPKKHHRKGTTAGTPEKATRRFRARRALRRSQHAACVVVDPLSISKESTRSFLQESASIVASTKQRDAIAASNMLLSVGGRPAHQLRSSGSGASSLFLGPRSAIEGGHRLSGASDQQMEVNISFAVPSSTAPNPSPMHAETASSTVKSDEGTDVIAMPHSGWLRQHLDETVVSDSDEEWLAPTASVSASRSSATLSEAKTAPSLVTVVVDDSADSFGTEASDGPACRPSRPSNRERPDPPMGIIDVSDDSEFEVLLERRCTKDTRGSGTIAATIVVEDGTDALPHGGESPTKTLVQCRHGEVEVVPLDLQDIVELLRVFDVRFVIGPSEADAQCALLSRLGVVDGVFTEDSDVLAHGAHAVLRGFFSTGATVRQTRSADLHAAGLDRATLLMLTYLLGCDYNDGVGLKVADALSLTSLVRTDWRCAASTAADDVSLVGESEVAINEAIVCLDRMRSLARIAAAGSEGHAAMSSLSWVEDLSLLQDWLLRKGALWKALGTSQLAKQPLNASTLLMFTDYARVNRAVRSRPSLCQPQWDSVRRLLTSRRLTHLMPQVEAVERQMQKRMAGAASRKAHVDVTLGMVEDEGLGESPLDRALRLQAMCCRADRV